MFLFDAGKIIVAIAIVLWVLSSYGPGEEFQKTQLEITILKTNSVGTNDGTTLTPPSP